MPLITTYQKRNTPYWLNFIYSGQFFNFNTNFTIAPSGEAFIVIKTSDIGRLFHLLSFDITSNSSQMNIYLYENVTYTGGTLKVAKNSDRRSTKTADTLFYINPTYNLNGTIISQYYLVTTVIGSGYNYNGIFTSGLSEMLFKKNTNYILRLSNGPYGSGSYTSVNINFYESGN